MHKTIAVSLLLISVAMPASAAPPANAKPPVASAAQPVELVAIRAQAASASSSVNAGGLLWQCVGSRCSARATGNPVSVMACQGLAQQVGSIKSFGSATSQLDANQLRTCNIAAGPAAGVDSSPAMAQLPSQPKSPGFAPNTSQPGLAAKPAVGGMPNLQAVPPMGKNNPAIPAGPKGGGFAGLQNQPAETPRHAGARALAIVSVRGDHSSCANRELTLIGRNFDDKIYNRSVVLQGPRGEHVETIRQILSWSDTRIATRLSYGSAVQPGQSYRVAIVDDQQRVVATGPMVQMCVREFNVSGALRLSNCNANLSQLIVEIRNIGGFTHRIRVESNPTDDFSYRYTGRLPAISGRYEVTPKFTSSAADICPGATWTPASQTLDLDFVRHQATRNFELRSNYEEHQIPAQTLADVIQAVLRRMEIHLNNFNPEIEGVPKSNDSYIRFPEALIAAPNNQITMNIPPSVNGPRKYFINDLNLARVNVFPAGRELRIQMMFEKAGMELIGWCRNDLGCLAGAPDVELGLTIDVYLTLDRFRNRRDGHWDLSFSQFRVETHIDAQADGLCLIFDFICTAVNDYRSLIRDTVERNLKDRLDTAAMRENVGRALRPFTCRGELQSVREERGRIWQRCLPPATARRS